MQRITITLSTKQSRLDLSILSPELRSDFIEKRQRYKEGNIERIRKMKETISVSSHRKQAALDALPPRLAFICKTSRAPQWTSDLSRSVKDSYFNLHHTAKTTPSTTSSLHLESDKYYDIHKLRHKQKEEIAVLDDERMHRIKQYKFPSTPLEHFPPIYDPGDIRTQPAYVRSFFDYTYKEGMDVPIKEKEWTIDPDVHLNDDERRQIYGHDYAGVQLNKVVHVENLGGGGIGGTEDLKKKLQQEEEANLTAKQKLQKERGKKTAEARAEANKKMEKIRQAKLRVKESVDQWDKSIKMGERKKKRREIEGDGEDEESRRKKREEAERRIGELEILNKDLPSMEALLVDKEKNKEFFEKTLPVMLNHEFLDEDKKNECIVLVRKYHTLQTHVGPHHCTMRFYCDYCDTYLTHDSFSGRQQHQKGKRHQDNVRQYYMQFLKRGILDNMQNILIPGMGSVPTTSQAAARATPGRPGSNVEDAPLIPNASLIGHKMPKVPPSLTPKKTNGQPVVKDSGQPTTHPSRAALIQDANNNAIGNHPPRPPRYSDLDTTSGFGGGGHGQNRPPFGNYGPSRGSFGASHQTRHNPYR